MAEPFVGEIRMFGGNFAPVNWSFCNGSLQSIEQYSELFTLIGTTYGGDGQTTFALPNLLGRIPFHQGTGNGLSTRTIGQLAGQESVTLTTPNLPTHAHPAQASTTQATAASPVGNVWATWGDAPYTTDPPNVAMDPAAIGSFGNSQPHENMPPFLAISFIIAMAGIFPSQS